MVRREEQPWQSRATLFLDNRAVAHRGQGIALVARGRRLGRRLDRGPPVPARLHRPAGHRRRRATRRAWHERGAELNTGPAARGARRGDVDRRPRAARHHRLGEDVTGGSWSACSAPSSPRTPSWCARFPRHSAQSLALALDVDVVGPARAGAATRLRRRRGWRDRAGGPRRSWRTRRPPSPPSWQGARTDDPDHHPTSGERHPAAARARSVPVGRRRPTSATPPSSSPGSAPRCWPG